MSALIHKITIDLENSISSWCEWSPSTTWPYPDSWNQPSKQDYLPSHLRQILQKPKPIPKLCIGSPSPSNAHSPLSSRGLTIPSASPQNALFPGRPQGAASATCNKTPFLHPAPVIGRPRHADTKRCRNREFAKCNKAAGLGLIGAQPKCSGVVVCQVAMCNKRWGRRRAGNWLEGDEPGHVMRMFFGGFGDWMGRLDGFLLWG